MSRFNKIQLDTGTLCKDNKTPPVILSGVKNLIFYSRLFSAFRLRRIQNDIIIYEDAKRETIACSV